MAVPRGLGAKDFASSKAPRAKHLEDEETHRDLFGVVRSRCTVEGCDCRCYTKKTAEYTVKPEEYGKRLHPHNDVTITHCSVCGHRAEDHMVDGAMNDKEMGNDSYELGNFDEAIAAYSRGIQQKPDDEHLWSNRAACWLSKGLHDRALPDATRAVELAPGWAKGRARKASAHYGLGQYDQAAREYQLCLKLDQENEEYAAAMAKARRAAVAAAAAAAQQRSARESADPKTLGDESMRKGEYSKAVEFYTRALKSGGEKDPKIRSNRSAAHAKLRRFEEALEDAGAAVRLAPGWPKAWYRQGVALYNLGRREEALRSHERCLRLDPSDEEVQSVVEKIRSEVMGSAKADRLDALQSSVTDLIGLVRSQSSQLASILTRMERMESCAPASAGSHSHTSSCDRMECDHLQEELVKERTLRQVAEVAAEEDQHFLREQVRALAEEKAELARDNARLEREARAVERQLEIVGAEVAARREAEGLAQRDAGLDDSDEFVDVQESSEGGDGSETAVVEEEERKEEEGGGRGDAHDEREDVPNFEGESTEVVSPPSGRVGGSGDGETKVITADDLLSMFQGKPAKESVAEGGIDAARRVWDALSSDGDVEGEDSRDVGLAGDDEDEERWLEMEQEWNRVESQRNEAAAPPPTRERRPFHQSARPLHGGNEAVLGVEDLLGLTNPAEAARRRLREDQEEVCRARVRDGILRRQEAEGRGEYVRETCLDFITQVKRGRCADPSVDCPGFTVVYREADAMDPEVMLYCSLCGHPANDHPVDAEWVGEQERSRRRREEEERRREAFRPHRRRAATSAVRESQERVDARRALGVGPKATRAQITKIYRKMALRFHPDKNNAPGASEKFVKLTRAFQVLTSAG